jgi:hypothetical protein
VSCLQQSFVRAFGRIGYVTFLPLYSGKHYPLSRRKRRVSATHTHISRRDPVWLRAPCGFGSLGACPGHSSTVIAASSAPNSLHIRVLNFPDSQCINAATADSFPQARFTRAYSARDGLTRTLGHPASPASAFDPPRNVHHAPASEGDKRCDQ